MTSKAPHPGVRRAADDRQLLAVRQSLRWATNAAAEKDYATALCWLAIAEAVDGELSGEWEQRRRDWERASV